MSLDDGGCTRHIAVGVARLAIIIASPFHAPSQKLPEEVKDELPDTIRRNEELFKKLEESSKSSEPIWKTQR